MLGQTRLNFETFRIDQPVRDTLNTILKNSKYSRAYLAVHIQELSGQICSEEILHNWTGPSRSSYRIPACVVPAFCEVTRTNTLLETILNPLDKKILSEEDIFLAKVGKLYKEKFKIETEIAKLEGH